MNTALLGGNGNFSAVQARGVVPEPGAVGMLLGTGVAGTLMFRRRRQK
jgi:hypothetical protein